MIINLNKLSILTKSSQENLNNIKRLLPLLKREYDNVAK